MEADGNNKDSRYTCNVILFAFSLGLVPGVWFAGAKWGAPAMAACACFSVGAILGLLFGIPRSLPSGSQGGKGEETGAKATGYEENTNLEQVSDWLTKILIGASLVQMKEIKDLLVKLATRLALCMGEAGCVAFALFLIIYFTALGFLGSYLLSRLFLAGALMRANQRTTEEEKKVEVVKQLAEMVGESFGVIVDPQLPPPDNRAKAAPMNLAREVGAVTGKTATTDDPNKGRFGSRAECNNRQLSATVESMRGTNGYFRVHLEVKATGGAALDKAVTFHIHPTFKNAVLERVPVKGLATLDLVSWGAFTVGVVTDEGKTKLELDLAELPGVPVLFASR